MVDEVAEVFSTKVGVVTVWRRGLHTQEGDPA
jgi:hypothetical protein